MFISGKKPQEAAEVDFSRLNVRVGKIVSVRRHPDADGLFVEEGLLFCYCCTLHLFLLSCCKNCSRSAKVIGRVLSSPLY